MCVCVCVCVCLLGAIFKTLFYSNSYGGDEGCEYVGCTATIAYLWRDNGKRYLVVGNVGDSHAFIWLFSFL